MVLAASPATVFGGNAGGLFGASGLDGGQPATGDLPGGGTLARRRCDSLSPFGEGPSNSLGGSSGASLWRWS